MKKLLVLILLALLLFSIVFRSFKLAPDLRFGSFNSVRDGDYLKIMVDITNISNRNIEGKFWVNLLEFDGNIVKTVYFQFPKGGIKPKETNKFSIEVKDVKFVFWQEGSGQYLRDSTTDLLWKLVLFIILVIPVYPLLKRIFPKKQITLPDKSNKIYDEGLGFGLENRQGEVIHEASLKNSKWEGVDVRESSLTHVSFEGSKLEHINFSNVAVNWIQISGTTFENTVRPNIEADGAAFKNSDLSNAVFEGCKLQNVTINSSNIEGLKINGILVSDLLEKYKS